MFHHVVQEPRRLEMPEKKMILVAPLEEKAWAGSPSISCLECKHSAEVHGHGRNLADIFLSFRFLSPQNPRRVCIEI